MAAFDVFIPSINVHVSMCPRVIMINAIKSIVRQFLDETHAWVIEVEPDIDCDDHPRTRCEVKKKDCESSPFFMELYIPLPMQACFINKVWSLYGMNEIPNYPKAPRHHFKIDPIHHKNLLVIDEKPQCQDKKFNLILSLSTMQNALECPDFVFQMHLDTIVHGCAYYLMSMDKQDWSNPNLAVHHLEIFKKGIEDAKNQVQQGFGISRQTYRVKPRYM